MPAAVGRSACALLLRRRSSRARPVAMRGWLAGWLVSSLELAGQTLRGLDCCWTREPPATVPLPEPFNFKGRVQVRGGLSATRGRPARVESSCLAPAHREAACVCTCVRAVPATASAVLCWLVLRCWGARWARARRTRRESCSAADDALADGRRALRESGDTVQQVPGEDAQYAEQGGLAAEFWRGRSTGELNVAGRCRFRSST